MPGDNFNKLMNGARHGLFSHEKYAAHMPPYTLPGDMESPVVIPDYLGIYQGNPVLTVSLDPVWSKYSCSFLMVIFQQST